MHFSPQAGSSIYSLLAVASHWQLALPLSALLPVSNRPVGLTASCPPGGCQRGPNFRVSRRRLHWHVRAMQLGAVPPVRAGLHCEKVRRRHGEDSVRGRRPAQGRPRQWPTSSLGFRTHFQFRPGRVTCVTIRQSYNRVTIRQSYNRGCTIA
jgi:hypothetical protein